MISIKRKLNRLFDRAWSATLNLIAIPLASVSRRDSSHWLFGYQGGLFAGNSRFLFIWLSIHRPDIVAVWICETRETETFLRNLGFAAYRRWSFGGILAALRSAVYIYSHNLVDVNVPLSRGAFLVNLWHGVGLKSVMLGDKTGVMSHYQKYSSSFLGRLVFYEYLKKPDVVVTTAYFMQEHFASQFELPITRCPMLGYPRLDIGTDLALRERSLQIDQKAGFQFPTGEFKEIYCYMPTWRDTGRAFLEQALPDLERLSSALKSRNALLYVKLHPWTQDEWRGDLSNVRQWSTAVEIQTYLGLFDAMITDYSSVYYDYIYLKDSGAVLYTFDLEAYVSQDHSFLYPFEENTAGLRVATFDELCTSIATGRIIEHNPGVGVIREKFWGTKGDCASANVVSFLESQHLLKQGGSIVGAAKR